MSSAAGSPSAQRLGVVRDDRRGPRARGSGAGGDDHLARLGRDRDALGVGGDADAAAELRRGRPRASATDCDSASGRSAAGSASSSVSTRLRSPRNSKRRKISFSSERSGGCRTSSAGSTPSSRSRRIVASSFDAASLLGVLGDRPRACRRELARVLDDVLERAVLRDELAGRLVADARDAGDVVARVALEPDEVRDLVGPDAVARLDALRRVDLDVRDAARGHHQADVLGDELERVAVGRDDARLDARLVRLRRERRDDVVGLPALELEVLVPERLDDRPEVRELLAQEVRHRPPLGLVLGVDLLAVHRPRVPGDRDAARPVVREQLEEHVREAEQRVRRLAVGRLQLLGEREERAVREVVAVDEEELGVACRPVVEHELLAGQRLRAHLQLYGHGNRRDREAVAFGTCASIHARDRTCADRHACVPLLSGSRIVTSRSATTTSSCARRRRPTRVVDVAAAVRDALRSRSRAAARRARARGGARRRSSSSRPRSRSRARRTIRARTRSRRCSTSSSARGIPDERQTLLVAGGLARRVGQRELERLLPPPQARAFRGSVLVHDAADRDLVPLVGRAPASTRPSSTPTSSLVVGVGRDRRPRRAGRARSPPATRRPSGAPPPAPLARPGGRRAGLGAGARGRGRARARASARSASRSCSTTRGSRDAFAATRTSRLARARARRSPFRRLYSLLPGARPARRSSSDQSRALAATAAFAGTAVGRARGGARPDDRAARHPARRAARRARRRRAVDRPARARASR